jgi:hypothetical protein
MDAIKRLRQMGIRSFDCSTASSTSYSTDFSQRKAEVGASSVSKLHDILPFPNSFNRQANREASKALLTQPYEVLKMPTDTSKLFRDPYNTTGIYKVFPGDDRRGNDIFATFEYTIEACLLACNKYNEFLGSGPKPCIAGTMNYNQEESANGQRGANCFLKTKAGDDIDNTNPMALGFRLCPSGHCLFNNTN